MSELANGAHAHVQGLHHRDACSWQLTNCNPQMSFEAAEKQFWPDKPLKVCNRSWADDGMHVRTGIAIVMPSHLWATNLSE